jgi:hypothetical protein
MANLVNVRSGFVGVRASNSRRTSRDLAIEKGRYL